MESNKNKSNQKKDQTIGTGFILDPKETINKPGIFLNCTRRY
jgi:hypothetical protein